jgi:hypothetical protein
MRAWIRGNKLYFDKEGWALIKKHAKKQHKNPKYVAIAALKRGFKLEKAKNS